MEHVHRGPGERPAPGGSVEQERAPPWPAQGDDPRGERVPWLRDASALRDEQHDLAGVEPEERVGEATRHAAEAAVGVEKGGPRVEADAHGSYDATAGTRFSVVIPTRMGWKNLGATLPPLLLAMAADDEAVIVADRCDVSVAPGLDPRCRVVAHPGPGGFAPACNHGAHEARGRLLLFLNDDVRLGAGVLERLADELRRPGVAAVGPDVVSEALARSESGTTLGWHHGVLESRQGALAGDGAVPVPYLCGAALAVRRADFLRLGGFDERLAPYFWEDLDLSLRLRERVGATVALAGVSVSHGHGATIGGEPERRRRVVYERNRLLVTWKHLRGWRWLAHLGWLPLRLLSSLLHDRAVPAGLAQAVAHLGSGRLGDARRD